MALKLRRGRHGAGHAYPTTEELVAFSRECCAVREQWFIGVVHAGAPI
jgi:hypothetical protein